MDKKPLHGKKILITRARDQSSEFSTRLRNLGAEVIEFPTIEILPPRSWKGLDRAIDQLKSFDWIIFTSANGVNFFLQRLTDRGENRSRSLFIKGLCYWTSHSQKIAGERDSSCLYP